MPKCLLLISFLFITPLILNGQPKSSLNTGRIVELECIQTTTGTLISASMERRVEQNGAIQERVLIHRSVDLGSNWSLIDSIQKTSTLNLPAADPVLSEDETGKLYLVLMRVGVLNSAIHSHLELYVSQNDGLSWSLRNSIQTDSVVADYPQIVAKQNGDLSLVYSGFTFGNGQIKGSVFFKRSTDGGLTWDYETEFIDTSVSPSGPDLRWTSDSSLIISYGHSQKDEVYALLSNDYGQNWTTKEPISIQNDFNICKPVSGIVGKFNILSLQHHQTNTSLYWHSKNLSDTTWNTNLIDEGAYAEAVVDSQSNIHLVYNQKNANRFMIRYTQSIDSGKSFEPPVTLFSAAFDQAEMGEYQSLFIGQDGRFYLTFCDWSDQSKAKILVFQPFTNSLPERVNHQSLLFPNPASDHIFLNLKEYHHVKRINVLNSSGEMVMERTEPIAEPILKLEISSLKNGLYFLHIQEENRIVVERFIKH